MIIIWYEEGRREENLVRRMVTQVIAMRKMCCRVTEDVMQQRGDCCVCEHKGRNRKGCYYHERES